MSKEKQIKTVQRNVLESYTRDVGRGTIRMDYDTMDELGLATGDPALLTSEKKKTVAKTLPLYPSDENKDLVRIDSIVRENLGVAVGNLIKIEKTHVKPAEQILVHPIDAIPEIDSRYLADALESVAVMSGDKFAVPYFGGKLTFKVLDTKPDGAVVISQHTEFIIEDEDLPDELREFEEHIINRKTELLKNTKEKILKNLQEKKYENVKDIIITYKNEISNLTEMKKDIRRILSEERELGKGENPVG